MEDEHVRKIEVHITEVEPITAKDLVSAGVNTGIDWVSGMIVAMIFFIGIVAVIGWIFG